MSKIAIWGPPTSGKSHMSVQLAQKYKIETIIHTDDYLTWDPKNKWNFMPKTQFLKIINPLLKELKWVVDGNLEEYISRERILEEADLVIILNPSYLKLFYRIVTRSITRNTWFKIGTHTKENATIYGVFSTKDLILEIIDSFRIVANFKKRYIHYLLEIAKKTSNLSKIKIVN